MGNATYYNEFHKKLFSYEATADGDNIVINEEKYMPIKQDSKYAVKMLKTKIKSNMNAEKFAEWLMKVRDTDKFGLTKDALAIFKLHIFEHIMTNGLKYTKQVKKEKPTPETAKYIMLVGNKTKFGTINNWYKSFGNSIKELKEELKEHFKKRGITWEQNPDEVAVFKIITMPNGFRTIGDKKPYYKDTTKSYWMN